MSNVSFIRGASGAMRRVGKAPKVEAQDLAERQAERATREARAMHIAACISDQCRQSDRPCPTPGKCVIHTDNRLLARFMRWLAQTTRRSQT